MECGSKTARSLGTPQRVHGEVETLLMRKVTLKGKSGRWESALDQEEEEEFSGLLRDRDEIWKIRFPRCVFPLEGHFKKPLLLLFGDRLREACCSLVYLR